MNANANGVNVRRIDISASVRMREKLTAAVTTLGEGAEATERLGRLPDANFSLLVGLGIPAFWVPKRWGGLELAMKESLDVITTLAAGCMSTAWCAALYATHPWLVAHFSEAAQADVWSKGPDVAVCLSVASVGEGVTVSGGFELTGTWPFVSGCDHGEWFLLPARCASTAEGTSKRVLLLVPRADVEIDHGSWEVAALRGTGSKTVSVKGKYVPIHRMLDMDTASAAAMHPHNPPLYRQHLSATLGPILAGVALGGAEAAYEFLRERMKKRVIASQSRVQAADPTAQLELAEIGIRIRAARLLFEDLFETSRLAGEESRSLTPAEVSALQLQKVQAVRLAAEATARVFASSGGAALLLTNPLQRYFRDVHAVQNHADMSWTTHARNYGSLAVGLEPTVRKVW